MAEFNRKAGAMWYGDSRSGHGTISTESRALFEQPYSYQTRFQEQPGTNPEELLAAAHAACLSMALAGVLKKNGIDPREIETSATCTITSTTEGFKITGMHLHVRGEVPGIDELAFRKLVAEADRVCPVSNLLGEGLEIEIEVDLAQAVPH